MLGEGYLLNVSTKTVTCDVIRVFYGVKGHCHVRGQSLSNKSQFLPAMHVCFSVFIFPYHVSRGHITSLVLRICCSYVYSYAYRPNSLGLYIILVSVSDPDVLGVILKSYMAYF